MNETQQPDPQTPHAGFCQICGRGVASEADRFAGRAFPCGLCNEVKLAAPASTGYVYPGPDAAPGFGAVPPGAVPPPGFAPPTFPPKDVPNPGLAALLGLIPGVGAMYNGQYAKGIVHLVVFAVLSSLVDTNAIFLLFVFGWVAYQAIEAHHTARARRDGSPLPNPFGLNDIGERLGFGKSWPAYPATPNPGVPPTTPVGASPGASPNASPGASWSTGPLPPTPAPGYPPQQPTSTWGAPWESYRYQVPPVPPLPPFTPPPYPPYAPVSPGMQGEDFLPFDPTRPGFEAAHPAANRFPAGAIWLIALGTLFLLNTSGIFRGFSFRLFLPLLFVGLGVWQFLHKMTRSGFGMADDGTPAYRIRVFRAARGSVWLILLGVIFFLADFHILPWGRSWPLFLILAGVMTFLERAVYRGVSQPLYGYPPPATGSYAPPTPPTPVTTTALSTATAAPPADASQEGR